VLFTYLHLAASRECTDAVRADPALALGVNVVEGSVVYGPVAEAHGMPHVALADIMAT
jgi:alanine dehydrogenase